MYKNVQLFCFFIAGIALFSFQCTDFESSSDYSSDQTNRFVITGAFENLIKNADSLATKKPVSINNEKNQYLGFHPGTYASMACYWWPDPAGSDGLPYIRVDGHVNPDTRTDRSDLPAMIEMAKRTEVLALAYKSTGNEIYAEHAMNQLYTWFIDPNTAMLPHLEHAQMIRGVDTGRSYGVIDTWWLVRVIQSIPLLEESGLWNDAIEKPIQNWFTHYLNWLRNSEFGLKEMESKNNHGTWYDVQVVTIAVYLDQTDFAKLHLETVSAKRINRQITRNGRQRYETRRPRPEHYSIYNISGWLELLMYAEHLNADLQQRRSLFGGTIEDGVLYLISLMQTADFDDILDPMDRTDSDRLYLDLLFKSSAFFENPAFYHEIKRIHPLIRNPEIVFLRYPEDVNHFESSP